MNLIINTTDDDTISSYMNRIYSPR